MKKVLVATCVVAMTAFGITNASADPVATARANAYGVNVGGSLLGDVVERTPEVTSVLPPGGLVSDDIITVPVEPVVISGTGVVVANTSVESSIVPFMSAAGGQAGGGPGDLVPGGGGAPLPALPELGVLQAGEAGVVQAQQALPPADGTITLPTANADGFARIEDATVLVEDTAGLGALPPALLAILVDGLVSVDVISAEAAALCAGNEVVFDTAASVVGLNDEPIQAVADLLATLSGIVPEDILSIRVGEQGITEDGTGFFVNALHITLLGTPGTEAVPGVPEVPEVPGVPGVPAIPEIPALPGVGTPGEPLLDIILGHAEVSATQCAAPPPTSLVPTGDDRPSLPRTGGLGALPAVLGVGLLGGALTAGRFALRARRNGDSL